MTMDIQKRQLCDIQGRLFELSLKKGFDSENFIDIFMNSSSAERLDDVYDRLQWAGEEYILEEIEDLSCGLKCGGKFFPREMMYWAGYVYRYWHYLTGETSKEIYNIADGETMSSCWQGFHTLDVEAAVDGLKEIYRQKHKTE